VLSVGGHVGRAPLFWLYSQVPSAGCGRIATEVTKLLGGGVVVVICASSVVVVIVDTVHDAVAVATGSLEGPLSIGVHHRRATMRIRRTVEYIYFIFELLYYCCCARD